MAATSAAFQLRYFGEDEAQDAPAEAREAIWWVQTAFGELCLSVRAWTQAEWDRLAPRLRPLNAVRLPSGVRVLLTTTPPPPAD